MLPFRPAVSAGDRPVIALLVIALLVVALLPACGGGGTGPTPSASPRAALNPGQTVMIEATGVNPKEMEVAVGSRVAFMNHDNAFHEMSSDPHPSHGDCPEMAAVGALAPGGIGQTGVFARAATCTYHDHGQPTNPALQGRIVVR